MSGPMWFLAGLALGIFGLAIQRVYAARGTRAAIAGIRALAAGHDPEAPRSSEHGEVFRAAREIADARAGGDGGGRA